MTTQELIKKIVSNFEECISKKNRWGKDEVLMELNLAISEEVLKELEQESNV